MKKILISILAIVMVIALVACGSSGKDSPATTGLSDNLAEGGSDNVDLSDEEVKKSSPKSTPAKISDKLDDFEFSLNGIAYKLPVKVSQLVKNGWEIEADYKDHKSYPRGWALFSMENNGAAISVKTDNFGVDTVGLEECHVVGVDFSSYDEMPDVVIAKGFTLESPSADVEKLFGAPDPDASGDAHKWYYFTTTIEAEDEFEAEAEEVDKGSVSISVSTDAEGDEFEVSNISLDIEIAPPAEDLAAPRYAGEIPTSVTDYKAPGDLGSKPDDFRIKIDGVNYQMPAPVSTFVENGWKVEAFAYFQKGADLTEEINRYLFPAMSYARSSNLTLTKGEMTIDVGISNDNDIAQPISNCLVTFIRTYTDDLKSFELPGGINVSSSIDAVKTAYGTPTEEMEGDRLTYDDFSGSLELSYYEGAISSISYELDIFEEEE